ncbi:MAG TPA: hypothetical protein PLZ84_01810, partial [Clostridia bacterium]|nr:hypothetical protein [Clostridia bacterium]
QALSFMNIAGSNDKYKGLPVLWLMSELRRDWITLASRLKVKDVMPLPLDEKVFFRKLKNLIGSDINKENMQAASKKLLPFDFDVLIESINKAGEEGYPLSVLRMKLLYADFNFKLIAEPLTSAFRRSDIIMEKEPGDYVVICLNAGKNRIPVFENKLESILTSAGYFEEPDARVTICGAAYPEDASSPGELMGILDENIMSQNISYTKHSKLKCYKK